MGWKAAILAVALVLPLVELAHSDELTQMVQRDLITLGYDPGPADGEPGMKTIIAVSKFQAKHNLEATGEITPQLAGVLQAAIEGPSSGSGVPQAAAVTAVQTTPAQDAATLKERQQACLQDKVAAAEKSNSMKRGFGKLLNAVSRTSSQFGGGDVASTISTTSSDVYSVNASVSDFEGAAKDLGITESDVEACRDP